MKIACALVSTVMVILYSIELSSQTSRNRSDASVPLLRGMQSSTSSDDENTTSRGYSPPHPRLLDLVSTEPSHKLGTIRFTRFACTHTEFPPTVLYERLFKFSEKHVLKCEVPNSSTPLFEPINNQGTEYPVAVNINGDIVGIYIAASHTILRIYNSDPEIQVTVNMITGKVKPYSKVFE